MQPDPPTAAATASTRIRRKLDNLRFEQTECYIYRVPDHVRTLNPSAYEPHILAIGPYHHGKGNTKLMENLKWLYLKSRFQEVSVDPYVSAIEDIKQEALNCYADRMDFTPEEFADMMLLDGWFIVELLLNVKHGFPKDGPIYETGWMLNSIKRDLMLFENQIPFVVLCKLFELLASTVSENEDSASHYQNLLEHIFRFFDVIIPTNIKIPNADGIKHLLHLIHMFGYPNSLDKPGNSWQSVSAATKLRDVNVKFEKNEPGASLSDITFKNGTLKLSHLRIADRTEAIFRNLIAYELYFPNEPNFATEYVRFLDKLIDTPDDVEILCKHGILDNWLGSDTEVSNIINKLLDSVIMRNDFRYAGVCYDVNTHCKKKTNKWMAMLMRIHLRSPWAILSIIAAGVLLLLTAAQTVSSVIQL